MRSARQSIHIAEVDDITQKEAIAMIHLRSVRKTWVNKESVMWPLTVGSPYAKHRPRIFSL